MNAYDAITTESERVVSFLDGKEESTRTPRGNKKCIVAIGAGSLLIALVLLKGCAWPPTLAMMKLPFLGMAKEVAAFTPIHGFSSDLDLEGMKWYCEPGNGKEDNRESKDGWWKVENGKLLLAPPAKKDFWRKTFYQPLLVKDDGSFLYATISQSDLPATIETSFSLTPKAQFDQAGIMIRLDEEHWIKTGIEVVDQHPRLSCVVTNGFCDWSTQKWNKPEIRIRVHLLPQHGGSFVVEAAPVGTDDWAFIRITHMNLDFNHNFLNSDPAVRNAFKGDKAPPGTFMVGVFAASPVDQAGMVATFNDLSITKGSEFAHNA